MKTLKTMGAFLFAGLLMAGCGGSGGSSNTNTGTLRQQATTSQLVGTIANLGSIVSSQSVPALVVKAEAAGLKAQTGECTIGETSMSCPCAVSGTFSFDFSSDTSFSYEFAECSFETGSLIDGSFVFTSSDTGGAIEFQNVSVTYQDCGTYTLDGTETFASADNSFTIDMTATTGSDVVNIDGDLTFTDSGLLNGTLTQSGAVTASCTFSNTDVSVCPAVADACGLNESEICNGDAYQETADICAG